MAVGGARGEAREVGLQPRVLVAPKNNAGPVDVEEEDGGSGWRGLQQVVLHGEVEEWVI